MDPLQPGDPRQVGKYRLLGRLGEGGMGQVFFGRSPGGRPVAVKLIRYEYARRQHFRDRFAREVEAARAVGGFHTALVVDADPDADPPWMATAYIAGPSLHDAVAGHGPLDARAVRTLGAALAEGLAAIHACESASISVNGVQAGRWAPVDGVLNTWMDQTVELPSSLTKGRRSLTVRNTFESSSKDFNEFIYLIDQEINGAWVRADVVDVGPGHPAEEKAHNYHIANGTWEGTQTFGY